MKNLLILSVLLILVNTNSHFNSLDSREMEIYIRARGTVSIAAVRFDNNNNNEIEDKSEGERLLAEDNNNNNNNNNKVDLFNNQKVEVPNLCEPSNNFIDTSEWATLAYAGESLQKCWVGAAGGDIDHY